ncbi:MAG: hypothetical protein ACOC2Y_07210 [Spirochaetota bacterium]
MPKRQFFGADGPVADKLRMAVAVPVTYGAEGTPYREDTEDPAGRVIAGIIHFSLSVSL